MAQRCRRSVEKGVYCQACGAENDDAHKFCGACGKALVQVCGDCQFENAAASRFCGGCGKPLTAAAGQTAESDNSSDSAPSSLTPSAAAADPERRQITVMFCDLVGSTQLSAQIDPEDLAELYQVYRRVTEQVMDAYDGYVAEYLGDGIVCYFGYPVALENAAERCVRAALATITALQQAEMPVTLNDDLALRIGIATGLVVAGDLLGSSDSSQVRTVVGETPNLAARLQSLAQPDHVVIADSTRRLLGDGFLLDELEPVQLKGIPGLVTPWLVRGTDSNAALRAASRHDKAIVGRSHELAIFATHWRSVEQGQGRTLLVSGEPGIGKSRLVRGFNEQLAELPHRWIALLSS
ncbi:MAG: adenylate/guanylate cyclase domain-containing protein, partial [Pseudomonadales bacterium]